jgi:hypothetical protein
MEKAPLFLTAIVLALGTFLYFTYAEQMADPMMYDDMELKTNLLDGDLKIFALARNNDLSMMRAIGNPIPEKGSMVIGAAEASMMMDEGLIEGPGNRLEDFFGLNISVEGILKKTGSIADDMHFLSSTDFDLINGDKGKLRIIVEESMPKAFYHFDPKEPLDISFAEGSVDKFRILQKDGKKFYPVIIGSAEAMMMKEEKLFAEVGDTIEGFFGTDIIVAGVLEETGTSIDMMHLVMKGGGI